MAIQGKPQAPDNRFFVTSVVASSVDPSRNVVTMQALVPAGNSQASAQGQAYDLPNATLVTNVAAAPVGGPYPMGVG